ncbi:MAG: hypothetical protein QOH21_2811, partial [Acidobacteriota bacterium]|nr:hypothetical protein [Acidobacteriota bacterium]
MSRGRAFTRSSGECHRERLWLYKSG